MNLITKCCIALLALQSATVSAQSLEFEITYDLQTSIEYLVDDKERPNLLAQDTIKLLPTSKTEHINEKFYSDGTSKTSVHIVQPNKALESWLASIDEIQSTDSRFEILEEGEVVYEEEILVDEENLTPPALFAPYYMATNNWQLPLSNQEVQEFYNHGYDVTQNTAQLVELGCDSFKVIYNKNDWTETLIKFDQQENEYFRQVVTYYPDQQGFLLYKDKITWTLDNRTSPCIQKLVYQRYENIERVFHNNQLAPTKENGYDRSTIDLIALNTVSVYQLEGTNTIYIDLGTFQISPSHITIKDMYGITVLDQLPFNNEYPYVDLGQLPTGVYSIHANIENYVPGKFIFRP